LYREVLAREAGKLEDLSILRTNHTDDLEQHWQDDMDWLCTVEFLPTDDPEARMFASDIIGSLFFSSVTNCFSISMNLYFDA
jgi:predicted secreted protein